LEDGVAPEKKTMAREEAGRLLGETDFGEQEVALRLNRLSTLYGIADIQAMADWPRKPDLIILPKVESEGEIRIYEELLTEIGAESELLLLVESVRGFQAATSMATASPRISAISFAIADLPAELGCRPTWESMFHIRSSIVVAGGVAGLTPIDPPYLNIKDEAGLMAECKRVRDMGYTGKICIHPSQLDSVNRAFTPTIEEVARARKIVDAAANQRGAIQVDGRMVDAPVVKIAQRLLDTAEHLGMLGDG
jgi:citrate lyase beta subunit